MNASALLRASRGVSRLAPLRTSRLLSTPATFDVPAVFAASAVPAPQSLAEFKQAVAAIHGPDGVPRMKSEKELGEAAAAGWPSVMGLMEGADEETAEAVAKFKAGMEEAAAMIDTEDVKPFDWDYWKATISYPGIVDEIKSVYDKFEPPSYEAHFQEWQAKINEEYKPVLAEVTKMAEDAEAYKASIEKEMAKTEDLLANIKTMTVEEYLEKNPKVRADIEEDLKNDRWFKPIMDKL